METAFGLDVFEEKYALPAASDLSRDEVISIATSQVARAFNVPEEELHPFQVAFLRLEEASEPVWYVSFVEGGYILLSRNGQLRNH